MFLTVYYSTICLLQCNMDFGSILAGNNIILSVDIGSCRLSCADFDLIVV